MTNNFFNYLASNSPRFIQKVSMQGANYLMLPFKLSGEHHIECEGEQYQVMGHHLTVNDKIIASSQYHHTIEAKEGSEEYRFHIYYSKSDEVLRYTKTRVHLEAGARREERSTVDQLIIPGALQADYQNAIAEYKAQWNRDYASAKSYYHERMSYITKLSGDMAQNKDMWLELTEEVLNMLQPNLQCWDDSYLKSACQMIDSCRLAVQAMLDSSSGEDSEEDKSPVHEVSDDGDKLEVQVTASRIKKPRKDLVRTLCDQALETNLLFDQLEMMLADTSTENAKLQEAYLKLVTAIKNTQEVFIDVSSIDHSRAVKKCFEECIKGRLDLKDRVVERLLAQEDLSLIETICDKDGIDAPKSVIQRAEDYIRQQNHKGYMWVDTYFDLPLTDIFQRLGVSYLKDLWEYACKVKKLQKATKQSTLMGDLYNQSLTKNRFFLRLAMDNKIMDATTEESDDFEVLHHIITGTDMDSKRMVIIAISNSDHASRILEKISDATEQAGLPGFLEYKGLAEDVRRWQRKERCGMLLAAMGNIIAMEIDRHPEVLILKEQLRPLQAQCAEQSGMGFKSFKDSDAGLSSRLKSIMCKILETHHQFSMEIALDLTKYHYEKEIERYRCLQSIIEIKKNLKRVRKSGKQKELKGEIASLSENIAATIKQEREYYENMHAKVLSDELIKIQYGLSPDTAAALGL